MLKMEILIDKIMVDITARIVEKKVDCMNIMKMEAKKPRQMEA
jgi:hypothetical protein